MKGERLAQVSAMYAAIMGISQSEAREAVLRTAAGREIARGSSSYLYEQQTSNLASVVAELPPGIRERFTTEKIAEAMGAIKKPALEDVRLKAGADPGIKARRRRQIKAEKRARLRGCERAGRQILKLQGEGKESST